MADKYTPRLKTKYDAEIAAAMTEKFGYKNAWKSPRSKRSRSTWALAKRARTRRRSRPPLPKWS
jgi:large subunit ribosomal protein L5